MNIEEKNKRELFLNGVKAFNKKRIETSLINALRISYKYITDRKSLYPKGNFNYTHTSRNMNLRPLVSLIVVSYNSGIDSDVLFLFHKLSIE